MIRLHRAVGLAAFGLTAALALAGCGAGNTDKDGDQTDGSADGLAQVIIGTTDKLTVLDPAGSYDNGSYTVEIQVYQFLYGFQAGQQAPQPDAAKSCDYTSDTVFECQLKPGLKFANGHDLTSSDVKFTFDRQIAINDPNGPASLLANLKSVEAPDDLTVRFQLKEGPDQTFLQVLATPVGPLVDEEVFAADKLTPDSDIVAAKAFSGPYQIGSYKANDTIVFQPNTGYDGVLGQVANGGVTLKTYSQSDNLKLAITNGEVDVAHRSLTPTDIADLESNDQVTVHKGPGGEIRYIVFNLETMPGGAPEQKLAVRQAIASLIDRDALAAEVYKDIFTPLCSWVPTGQMGATESACDTYPLDPTKADRYLADAGVAPPVALSLQYNPDHYGSSSDQEYARVKAQLEASGLFQVDLQSTEWVTYSAERVKDAYPAYQLGWFPDFPDPDNYLSPFFTQNNFINNHFDAKDIQDLIASEVVEADPAARQQIIEQIQDEMAGKYLSTLPLLQGSQVTVSKKDVTGVVLDASFQFRYGTIGKPA
ncbi:MAG: ABC transporter substrate-binding protein [Propionibacteriaceae bacterium]|jgi:peptide/nickel transport system substrate-binding protein|nr:ABC transporter substrate-binding protein [Propionibacteriaceae bacterium]